MKSAITLSRAFLYCCLAALAGCEMATGTGDHAVGVAFLTANGSVAARYQVGAGTTGLLTVQAGTTEEFRVRLLMRDGQLRDVDGTVFWLGEPTAILGTSATARLAGVDRISIEGRSVPAQTTVRFDVWHGGHVEFEVRDVVLLVQ